MARAASARDLSLEPSMKRVVVGLMVGGVIAVLCLALWLRPAAAPLPPSTSPTLAAPGVVTAAATAATHAPAVLPPELRFERLDIETGKETAEACLVFSQPLVTDDTLHYEDYLALTPAAQPALRRDGQRLCLAGLAFGTEYQALLRQGFPAADGAKLAADTKLAVTLRDRPPVLAFRDGLILPRENAAGVPVVTVNVERVLLKVIRVPDRMAGQLRANELAERQAYPWSINQLEQQRGAVVWKGEMTTAGHRNETVTTLFSLRDALPERKPGVYALIAEDAADRKHAATATGDADDESEDIRDYRPRAVQWVIDSDIGLTSFAGADGLHVFARSLASAEPMAGIAITLVARDNEELGKATTDGEGHVRFDRGLLNGKGGAAAVALLAYGAGGDFVFQDVTRPAFDLSDRGVEGRAAPGPVDAFLYSDRGIYRPKETVHITTLLRDEAANAIAGVPVTLVVSRPDGAAYRWATLADQAVGAVHFPLTLSDTAPRGHWHVDAYLDPKAPPVGRAEFEVADFVPQLLEVTLTSAAPALAIGTPVHVDAAARFLYGAPAAGLDGEAEATITADPDPFPAFRGYRFGLAQESFKEQIVPLTVAATDDAGKTAAEGALADLAPSTLPLRATIRVGIFEPGGRSTANTLILPLRRGAGFIGIKPRFSGGRVQEGSTAEFEVIALDGNGERAAKSGLHYALVREVTEYNWYSRGRGWGYERSTRDVPVAEGTVDVAAAEPAVVSRALPWGYYRLTVRDDSGAATSLRFSSGWAGVLSEDRPDRAEVTADRAQYKIGDTARLAIRPPSAGDALVIIANDRVIASKRVAMPADGTTVEMPVTAAWGTGAYAIVAVYRPLADERAHAPTRSIGVAWLPLDPASRTLAVELGAPDKIAPRQTIEVPVTVHGAESGRAFVTLAAIDEGILQLTKFRSPAPDDFYFGKRRLAVDIRDDYGRLIEAKGPVGALRSGGDAASLGGRGLEVVPTRTVALFSGLVALDGAGRAKIPLEVPDFNGELRLMAVAFDATKLGRAEARLTVRDAIVSDVTLPRFLAPGDQSRIALSLHNVEGAAGEYEARLETEGAVALAAPGTRTLRLESGERQLLSVPLQADAVGIGTVKLHLAGPNLDIARQWQIAVRPPQNEVARETVAALPPGKTLTLDAQMLDEYVPGTASLTVNVASWRTLPLAGLLQSLDRYPFGCLEQTTSRAFPLLYFNDVALLGHLRQEHAIEGRVQDAIDRVLDMQKADGHFGMWSGAGYDAYDGLGVYALDFLSQAKLKNYRVSADAIERGHQWLRRLVDTANAPVHIRAYAALVLARAGAIDLASLRYLYDTLTQGRSDALVDAELGAALPLAGDRARASTAFALLDRPASAIEQIEFRSRSYGGDYYGTPLRDWARLVAVAAEAGRTSLVARLFERYQWVDDRTDELTTQEKAWLMLAAHALSARQGKLELAVNGELVAKPSDPLSLAPDLVALAKGFSIANRGEREVWETVSIRGIPKRPLPAEASGLTLAREFWTLDGKPAALDAVHQNDRLIVTLRGSLDDDRHHEVALMDLLPAGFEIEGVVEANEKGESAYLWLGRLRKLRLVESRDDRFVAAFTARPERFFWRRYWRDDEDESLENSPDYVVAYIVRAVTPGTYVLPAATAEDMYRPKIRARTEMGTVTVLGRS
jgi:alpha-2-macroglobulin